MLVNIPLLYGTVGEIVTEKSGSLNLGVEGTMAMGAIFGYLAGCYGQQPAGGPAGLLSGRRPVRGPVCPAHRLLQANQNVTGLTITTFGLGLYFFMGKGLGDRWPVMTSADALVKTASPPGRSPLLSSIPVVGKALFSHNILVYLGILVAAAVWWYLTCTKTGLRLRSVGRTPAPPTRWVSTSCCISTST